MIYLTHEECRDLCTGRAWQLTGEGLPDCPPSGFDVISFMVPPERERLTDFSRGFASIVPFGVADDCLLWVMNWRDWGSSANYHLYYRLRQSYSDFRLIHQAPGHLFLGHEEHDLISFVELAFLFGWDFHLLPFPRDIGAWHDDELVTLYSKDSGFLDTARAVLARYGVAWEEGR